MAPSLRPRRDCGTQPSTATPYQPRALGPPLTGRFAESYNLQHDSPLFNQFPPEIRNRVFLLALAEDDILKSPVPFDSFGFRPEYAFRHTHAVALLRTCRRVYLEAWLIPVATATHVAWTCLDERAPFGKATRPRWADMTLEQRAALRTVRVFAPQYSHGRAGWAPSAGVAPGVRVRHLIVTIRHTDWWHWERDEALELDERMALGGAPWRAELRSAYPALEVFDIELETLERRRAELDALVTRVRRWRIKLNGGKVLSTDDEPVHARTWVGSAVFCGAVEPPDGSMTLPYYVATIRWRARAEAER